MTRLLRLIVLALCIIATGEVAFAATPNIADLGKRANRFFDQQEWASASAVLSLLIDARPDSIPLYGQAITAAGMRGAEKEQIALLNQALHARIPIDSVFHAVGQTSFSIGQSDLLERFLKLSAEAEPWLARKIDASLLDYYAFRRDADGMLEYADRLIPAMPDNETFLLRRAEALLLLGRNTEAETAFADALKVNPDSLTALLYLGELARARGDENNARQYFARAAAIDLTPRIQSALQE